MLRALRLIALAWHIYMRSSAVLAARLRHVFKLKPDKQKEASLYVGAVSTLHTKHNPPIHSYLCLNLIQ